MDKGNVNLPEAPASVTARVISDQGFRLLFTLRDTSVSGLLSKFDEFQKHILAKGWKPEGFIKNQEPVNGKLFASQISVSKISDKKVTTEDTVCPTCGAPAKKKSGFRKDGSRWEGIFCSTGEESHKVWLS